MSFLKKSILNFIGSIILIILNFAIGILLARFLQPSGLGMYSLVLSFVTIMAGIFSCGLGHAAVYFINNQRLDPVKVITDLFKYSVFLGGNLLFLFYFFSLYLSSYFEALSWTSFIIVGLYGFSLLLFSNLNLILVAFLKIRKLVTIRIMPQLFMLVLLSISAVIENVTVNNAWLFLGVSQIITSLVLIWFLRQWISTDLLITGKNQNIKYLFRYGLIFNFSYILLLLCSEIGLFLVGHFSRDFSEVGYYRLSIRLAGFMLILPKSLSPLFFSKLSKVDELSRLRQVEKLSRIYFIIAVLAILFLEPSIGYIVPYLYGESYRAAVPILQILLVGVAARLLMASQFNLFSSSGEPIFISKVLGVNLVIMIVLMSLLVPVYGGIGAALSFTVSSCIALSVGYLFSSTQYGLRVRNCLRIRKQDFSDLINAIHLS